MKSLERATKWCAFIINETNKNSNYVPHKQCLRRISRRMRNIHFWATQQGRAIVFSGSSMSTGQFRIKVFREAVTRGARHGCGPEALTAKSGVGPRPPTPACAPTEGKGAREGQPPQAPGLCQAGLFRAPTAPRDCPGHAQAVLGPATGNCGASGHRAQGCRAPGAGRGQPPAEPRPPTPAQP